MVRVIATCPVCGSDLEIGEGQALCRVCGTGFAVFARRHILILQPLGRKGEGGGRALRVE